MPHLLRLLVVTPATPRTGATHEPAWNPARLASLRAALRGRADVELAQRASADAVDDHDGVIRRVVVDGTTRVPAWHDGLPRLVQAAKKAAPDVVLVDGLEFPALVAGLRDALGPRVPIVVTAPADTSPPPAEGWMGGVTRARWRTGLAHADAVAFASDAQRAAWLAAGLFRGVRTLPSMPGDAAPPPTREEARARTGLTGLPLVLWLGAYTADDDPLTALAAFETFRLAHPDARLAMAGWPGPLEDEVRATVHRSLVLQLSVRILPPAPAEAQRDYISASHIRLSTRRMDDTAEWREGMAAGMLPVAPAIPLGLPAIVAAGAGWTAGDARDCALALARAWANGGEAACEAVRAQAARVDGWAPFAEALLRVVDERS